MCYVTQENPECGYLLEEIRESSFFLFVCFKMEEIIKFLFRTIKRRGKNNDGERITAGSNILQVRVDEDCCTCKELGLRLECGLFYPQ